ncbi:MAG: prepilin-type N-terminal cleavage/methylation domain-containing protein [Verrucomicrobiota bacterium]
MNAPGFSPKRARLNAAGFTLPEVMVSVAIVAVMFVSLYGGITSGFAILNASREQQRATQIMLEKLEVVRLYSWDQLNTPGYLPAKFTERYIPASATNATAVGASSAQGTGVTYYGTVVVSKNPPVPSAYTNTMRLVTITLNWNSGSIARSARMQTLISQYGIQDYVN